MPSVQFSSATSVQFTVAANKGSVETQGGRIWPESMRFSFTSPLSGGCEVNGTEFFEDGWDDVGLSAQIAGEVMRCRGACRHIITVMRPTKLTPKVVERIEKAVSLGNSYDEAARSAGIHPCTYYRWRARALVLDLAAEAREAPLKPPHSGLDVGRMTLRDDIANDGAVGELSDRAHGEEREVSRVLQADRCS